MFKFVKLLPIFFIFAYSEEKIWQNLNKSIALNVKNLTINYCPIEFVKEQNINTINIDNPKKLGPSKMSKELTPITEDNLKLILKESHKDVFGFTPSSNRIHMAWAQIAFENGRGNKVYNYNLGNIGGNPIKPLKDYYVISGYRFRSFNNFYEGARKYWKVLQERCSLSLKFFDAGDPESASKALNRCGYYKADIAHYTENLSSLFYESYKK